VRTGTTCFDWQFELLRSEENGEEERLTGRDEGLHLDQWVGARHTGHMSSSEPKTTEKPVTPTVARQPAIVFETPRVKTLAELRAGDIPRGLQPEDVATDYAQR
jgi:hypothetical protein